MQNLSRKELRLIAKNRNICGYKSIPKDKLLRIINNNERDRESLFKLKKGEAKKGLYKPTKNSTFKLKREKIKKGIYRQAKKSLFESQIEEIKEILHDSIIDRDEKIDEIKKILYDPRNNLSKQEEDNYKPERTGNAFSGNYIEYKSNGNKDKTLSPKDYLDEIKPYLIRIINDHKTQGEWKIKLTMAINFSSSKDSKETRTMYSPSDNIEVIIGIETAKINEDLFGSFLQRYQKGLEESMRGSEFFLIMLIHCIINFIKYV